jgi:hypothetical protein
MSQQQTFSGMNSPTVPDIEFIEGNTGGPVGPNPATFTLNIVGDTVQGVNVDGDPITFTQTITIDDATTTQKGVVLLADDPETVAGTVNTKAVTPESLKAKLGAQTLHGIPYGNATTGAIQWLAEATDGQIPIGDTGGVPILANITSTDASVTITNGPGSINLSVNGTLSGSTTTVGAVTGDVLTIPLGATPSNYSFLINVSAFESSTPAGAQYFIVASARTDGASASLVGLPDPTINEDAALVAADCDLIVSGNNAIVRATGVAALTINWSARVQVLQRT